MANKLLYSLSAGVLLTAITVFCGVFSSSFFPFVNFGCYDSPSGQGNDQDHSYTEGWFVAVSGETRWFRERQNAAPPLVFMVELLPAVRVGRPWQYVYYTHCLRGQPFFCVEYFWSADDPHVSHRFVPPEQLERYPEYKLRNIIWLGLVGDVAFWSALVLLFSSVPRIIQILVRRTAGRCHNCGYDLRGLPEPRCPECGRAFNPHRWKTKAAEDK